MIIVLIGLPGSGKGTQSQFLASKLKLPILSTGEIFRKIAEIDKKESASLNNYMLQGKLVPSEVVSALVQKFLALKEYESGCLLDGYPRNIKQAEFLRSITNQEIRAIFFEVTEQVVVKRILGRFTCINCKKVYNTFFDKPQINNICDICGFTDFVYRKDDNEEILKERIKVYNEETKPILEYYNSQGILNFVDATKDKKHVELLLSNLLEKI